MSINQNRPYNNNNNRRKFFQIVDEYEKPANGDRVVLPCNASVGRLLCGNGRARLLSQIINGEDMQKEVTSYFTEPSQYTECSYDHTHPISSRKSATLVQPRQKSFKPVHPYLVQGLRWNPYEETTTVSQTEVPNLSKCKCDKCTGVNSRFRVPAALKRQNIINNNIITYANQYTMTKTLTDASCGSAGSHIPLPCTPKMNDKAVTASDVAFKDKGERVWMPVKYQPAPILKRINSKVKVYKDFSYNANHCSQRRMLYDRLHGAEKDLNDEDTFFEPPDKPVKCFKQRRKKSCGHTSDHTAVTYPPCRNTRKVLYNEGISDDIASDPPVRAPCSEVNSECGRSMSYRWEPCCDMIESIPYSHIKSKYHKDCKNPSPSIHLPELKPFTNCPPNIGKNGCNRPCTPRPAQNVFRPRKMLSSEKDIDAFIKTGKLDT